VFSLLRKNWVFVFLFAAVNTVLYGVASFLAEPLVFEDLLSPGVLFFLLVSIASSFFASFLAVFLFRDKVSSFEERAKLVFLGVLVFSLVFLALNTVLFFSLSEEELEQSFLEAVAVSFDEFDFEQFKYLNFSQSIVSGLKFLLGNFGAGFAGLVFAELLLGFLKKR